MAIKLDDLHAPLGILPPEQIANKRPVALFPLVMLVTLVGVVAGWASLVDDPLGGEPHILVRVEPDNQHTNLSEVAIVGVKSVNPHDDQATVRDTLQAAAGGDGPVASSRIPRSPVLKLAELIEDSRMGPIPKIGADGTRPLDAYAVPLSHPIGAAPKIAIVVSGLGISQTATMAALDKLPPEITLAFMSAGSSLQRWSDRARSDGHETLLQVPMEPYDYPDNDSGPQTIVTSLDARENIDRLQWSMARITGYVGLMNYMGARATANVDTMNPVLGEVRRRGLMFLDDGTSSRSVVKDLAGAIGLPFATAEMVLDAVPSPMEIDARLSRLETSARTRGVAIGIASALPITINRLAEWSKSLKARGLELVPISYALSKPDEGGSRQSAPLPGVAEAPPPAETVNVPVTKPE